MNTTAPTWGAQETPRPILAVAHLGEKADPDNRLLLTEQSLQVYYKGKGRAFGLEYLQHLALEHRKLWFPLLGGGILASLCALSLLNTFHMPYRLLAGLALGLFGSWWGIRGSMALVVYEHRHHTDFLIAKVGSSLPVFVAFANRLIRKYPQPLGDYSFKLGLNELQQLQRQGFIEIQEPRLCLPAEAAPCLEPGPTEFIGRLNPYQLGPRLHWSLQEQELVVHVQGKLHAHEVVLAS